MSTSYVEPKKSLTSYDAVGCALLVVMLVVCGWNESFHEWRLSLVPALPTTHHQPPQDNMAAVHGRWVDGQLAPVWIDPGFGWFVECKGFLPS